MTIIFALAGCNGFLLQPVIQKKSMRNGFGLAVIFSTCILLHACKKNSTGVKNGCDSTYPSSRQIIAKRATVKLTATATYPVYLVEEGTIDTRLIPCNFPSGVEYYKDGLSVIVSGDVKPFFAIDYGPCCSANFVITSITK